MNGIFMLCFLFILITGFIMDLTHLRREKISIKATYGLITFLTLGMFISKYFHYPIPMPTRFFIQTISPWVTNLIGL